MGNASSGNSSTSRDRNKSGDSMAVSPGIMKDGQAFSFVTTGAGGSGPQTPKIILQNSNEDDDTYFAKQNNNFEAKPNQLQDQAKNESQFPEGRQRAKTVSEGTKKDSRDEQEASKILPTVFKWDGGGKQAYISGTFTEWKQIPMAKSHGDFVTILPVPEGEHQYKFFIDGEWKHNPKDPTKDSEIGSKNNIITVKNSDFEVFDALEFDSISTPTTQHVSGSPPGSEYGQEIPVYKPWEKSSGPPILPPHLLQVILNKDTPLSCEPTLLPEPKDHVMLNHLYALSIRDGVMVLSSTKRIPYRKKYVTTLLYKPI